MDAADVRSLAAPVAGDRGDVTPKVVVVTRRLDRGGTERHLVRILPRLRQAGIDASLFVLERGGVLEPELTETGVTIEGPGAAAMALQRVPRALFSLERLLRRERPDIVHFFLTEPYLVGSMAAALAGNPLRIMSRRSLAHYQKRHPVLAYLERRLHPRTDALIANSSAVYAELAHEVDDRSKLALIHNGVELPPEADVALARRIARRVFGFANDCVAMAIVANLIGYKGHIDLLAALARAKSRLPADWRLLVVGRDDGEGRALRRGAQERGIATNIVWTGERQDVAQFFAAADIILLASHEEGFSNSLIEAMAHGLPVIATAVGGNLDAVVPGETGLLVPPRAPTAMAEAIAALAGDAALRSRMGEAGRRRVEAEFSLDACVRLYVDLYRRLMAKKAA